MMTMNERLDIDEQAVAWVAKLLGGKTPDADKRAYTDWQATDARHAEASRDVEDLLASLDAAGEEALEAEMVREIELTPKNASVAASLQVFRQLLRLSLLR
ncbi:FecR/PupR family sigma factor regulator [Kordiimonas gwangyangensis]|uniref:FecR/PupR family sigma factor regulator n=1 Tax=Kordiimonas gwangyangensis TaxID=288022 RepID=UPI0004717542|nr:DUF4880 domain-containing protein [Kordiimonas gwangyangensis]